MMNWNILPEKQKAQFLERAKYFIEKGYYVGFNEEELAKMLYDSHQKNS